MDASSEVVVYSFRTLERGSESAHVAPFKATRQAIVDIHRGDPLPGTEEVVPLHALDDQGRYRRLPTGWGELN